ncbi:CDP-alcohol phosphatidyltransferase family protein [Microbacterium sp. NPDC057659]|uniref:CDP-alcohol phosphatidyltransferase family protein n=1 Tax=Microbacterium sp. NPDC057659 TaxID=3346198 RepID=UPI003671B226
MGTNLSGGVFASHRDALQRLSAAQKPSAGTPAYSRYVNRPLGRQIASWAYVAGLTPNGVTGISAVLTFSAVAVLAIARPDWWVGVAVCVLLLLGYAFDSADGQLARLRGGGSAQGEWLDHTVDAAKVTALHMAVLITAYRHFDFPIAWLLVPIVYVFVDNLTFFGMVLKDLLSQRETGGKTRAWTTSTSPLHAIAVIPTDYGVFCLMFLLLGHHVLFFGAYTLMAACNAVILVLVLVKWYRDMGALSHVS